MVCKDAAWTPFWGKAGPKPAQGGSGAGTPRRSPHYRAEWGIAARLMLKTRAYGIRLWHGVRGRDSTSRHHF